MKLKVTLIIDANCVFSLKKNRRRSVYVLLFIYEFNILFAL